MKRDPKDCLCQYNPASEQDPKVPRYNVGKCPVHPKGPPERAPEPPRTAPPSQSAA